MDIGGLPSNYTEYLSTSGAAQKKMNSISGAKQGQSTDAEMMDACKQFEEYLIEMVMDEVMKGVDIFGSGEDTSAAMSSSKDLIKDSLVQQMATKLSDAGDLGIAQKLYESMKRNTGIIPTPETKENE